MSSRSTSEPAPLVYLVSEYPSMTSSFIRREVKELRRRGLDLRCVSIRQPAHPDLLQGMDLRERDATVYVLPRSPLSVLASHLWAFGRSPGRYLGTLGAALRHRPELADRVDGLLRDEDLRQRLARAASGRIERSFTVQSAVEPLVARL